MQAGPPWRDPRLEANDACCAFLWPTLPRKGHRPSVPPPRRSAYSVDASNLWKWGFAAFYIIAFVTLMIARLSPSNLLFYPLCFSNAAIAYYYLYKKRVNGGEVDAEIVRRDDLYRAFSHGFFSGSGVALLIESVLSVLLLLAFYNRRKDLSEMDYNDLRHYYWVHLYLFLMAFGVAALSEEFTKWLVTRYSLRLYASHPLYADATNRQTKEAIVATGVAVGLGFGTVEAVLYVCFYALAAGSGKLLLTQCLLWLMRAFIAVPFHTVLGYMWGLAFTRLWLLTPLPPHAIGGEHPHYSWWKVAAPMVLWHGVYDFVEMEWFILIPSMKLWSIALAVLAAALMLVASYFYARRMASRLIEDLDYHPIPEVSAQRPLVVDPQFEL